MLLQTPLRKFLNSLPDDYYGYALIAMVLLSTVLVLMAKWASRRKATMTRKRKKLLLDQQEFVKSVVKAKKVKCVLFETNWLLASDELWYFKHVL